MTDNRPDTETLPASDDARAEEDDETSRSEGADATIEESSTDSSTEPTPAQASAVEDTEEEPGGDADDLETPPSGELDGAEEEGAAPPAADEEAPGGSAQPIEADVPAETADDEKIADPRAEIAGSEDPELAARSALGLGEKVEEEEMKPEEATAILEAAAKEEEPEEEEEAPDLEGADLVDVVEEEPSEPSPYDRPGDWYVVHTYSGYEKKVKSNLESRVKSLNMEGRIHEVVIPMDDVIEFKGGKKTVVQKKVFPGYLLVRMTLEDNSWQAVRNTPGVTGFVGSGAKPTPLSRKEVESILRVRPEDETKKARPRLEFEVGDQVRVTAGPFADFNGLIDEINVDQSTLKVLVNIFGRETPVTLEFSDVAKL